MSFRTARQPREEPAILDTLRAGAAHLFLDCHPEEAESSAKSGRLPTKDLCSFCRQHRCCQQATQVLRPAKNAYLRMTTRLVNFPQTPLPDHFRLATASAGYFPFIVALTLNLSIPVNQRVLRTREGSQENSKAGGLIYATQKKSRFYLCYFSARPGSWLKPHQAEERVALPELQVRHRLAYRQPETRVSLRRVTRRRRPPAARPERTQRQDRIRRIRARPVAVRRRILTPPTARIRTQIQIST